MFDDSESSGQISYWPSVSDLFMTLFIIAFAIVAAVSLLLRSKQVSSGSSIIEASDGIEVSSIRVPTNKMRRALGKPELPDTTTASGVVGELRSVADDVVKRLDLFSDQNSFIGKLEAQELTLKEKEKRIADLTAVLTESKRKLTALERLLLEKDDLLSAANDKPPIIKLAEASQAHFFASGKAEMASAFGAALAKGEFQQLAEEIVKRNQRDITRVDTLEVIGHTDGEPPTSKSSNLDSALPDYLSRSDGDLLKLIPGSNNDLGLLRALAIRREWHTFIRDHPNRELLEGIDVRCYSAGQTIPEGGDLTSPETFRRKEEKFRRIEIRLTRLGDEVEKP